MKSVSIIITLALGAIMLGGCAAPAPVPVADPAPVPVADPAPAPDLDLRPDFMKSKPVDADFMFATGTMQSKDQQRAEDRAALTARRNMAAAVEIELKSYQEDFQEELSLDEGNQDLSYFTQSIEAVVHTVLTGAEIIKSEVALEGDGFRAYVLVRMPTGSNEKALANRLMSEEALYTRFRASEAGKKLEEKVKQFDEWKASQEQ